MRAPWTNKTGLARMAAILATCLLIATGLCGANFFAVITFLPLGGGRRLALPSLHERIMGPVLEVAAWLELATMALCLCGLVMILIKMGFRALLARWEK